MLYGLLGIVNVQKGRFFHYYRKGYVKGTGSPVGTYFDGGFLYMYTVFDHILI